MEKGSGEKVIAEYNLKSKGQPNSRRCLDDIVGLAIIFTG